jgi:hypothetical protein
MTTATKETLELIKKLILVWDADFTKLTPTERKELEEVEKDMIENGTISYDDIDWDWLIKFISEQEVTEKEGVHEWDDTST